MKYYYAFSYLSDGPAINGNTGCRYGSWVRFESKKERDIWANESRAREIVTTADSELRAALRKLNALIEWGMGEEQAFFEAGFADSK